MQYNWIDENGSVISCIEKNKILNENMQEILQNIKDASEDAVLMGVLKENFVQNLQKIINECYNLKT
ncbi:MAG: hypothetical protein O3A66_02930 [Proteobacteria bacterium]|jgi:nitrogen regulatory protein PII-like uncharacterized protein|nr:hypothetical protein [Pseudomonadota bacterium]